MMRELGLTLDTAHYVGWHNVLDWARHLRDESSTRRALEPELASWRTRLWTNAMLADLYDEIARLRRDFIQVNTPRRRVERPTEYPRPWRESKDIVRIGKVGLPPTEFNEWYYGGD